MEHLSDLSSEHVVGEHSPGTEASPPPDRACLICKQRAWRWIVEQRVYVCGGDQALHEEYTAWHQQTFPWLHRQL